MEALAEEARRRAEERDRLVELVCHDLRTPLATILMSAPRLASGAPPGPEGESARRAVALVTRAAHRMERIVADLADAAALQSGRLTVDPAPQGPVALAREAIGAAQSAAHAQGVVLDLEAAPGLPEVHADRGRVLQVLGHLIRHAVQATPHGGRVAVRASLEGERVRFAVDDGGPALPEEERGRVFEPFRRGPDARHRGTALGLAVVRGIVAAHGGEVGVERAPDEGNTFWFTLPARRETH